MAGRVTLFPQENFSHTNGASDSNTHHITSSQNLLLVHPDLYGIHKKILVLKKVNDKLCCTTRFDAHEKEVGEIALAMGFTQVSSYNRML